MKKLAIVLFFVFTVFGLSYTLQSCKYDVLFQPTKVEFRVPAGFPQPHFDFNAAPLTKEGIDLGRKLFYDGRLSADGDYPCSSCHQQIAAFTTYDHDLSHGINHSHTTRNAPGLFNLAWKKEFQHDGSTTMLNKVYLDHITSPTEMGETMENVIQKLSNDDKYKSMFSAAFGSEQVTADRMFNALTQFLMTIVSGNSKYDKVKRGEASFNNFEELGYTVFKAKCISCHAEPLFTDHTYRNIGLPLDAFLKDYGRMKVTGNKNDSLKFAVPSLRNIDFTAYYMHDGRKSSIQQSIEHYRSGVVQSPTLDPSLQFGISLSSADVTNLIIFLRTLSDSSIIKNETYSKPSF